MNPMSEAIQKLIFQEASKLRDDLLVIVEDLESEINSMNMDPKRKRKIMEDRRGILVTVDQLNTKLYNMTYH